MGPKQERSPSLYERLSQQRQNLGKGPTYRVLLGAAKLVHSMEASLKGCTGVLIRILIGPKAR